MLVSRFKTSRQPTDEAGNDRSYHGVHGVVVLLAVLVVKEEHLHRVARVNLAVPGPGERTMGQNTLSANK